MPTYDYQCNACKEWFEKNLMIKDMNVPETEPCPSCGEKQVEKKITKAPALGDTVRMGMRKPDQGWKDNLKRIKESMPGSTIDQNSRWFD